MNLGERSGKRQSGPESSAKKDAPDVNGVANLVEFAFIPVPNVPDIASLEDGGASGLPGAVEGAADPGRLAIG